MLLLYTIDILPITIKYELFVLVYDVIFILHSVDLKILITTIVNIEYYISIPNQTEKIEQFNFNFHIDSYLF